MVELDQEKITIEMQTPSGETLECDWPYEVTKYFSVRDLSAMLHPDYSKDTREIYKRFDPAIVAEAEQREILSEHQKPRYGLTLDKTSVPGVSNGAQDDILGALADFHEDLANGLRGGKVTPDVLATWCGQLRGDDGYASDSDNKDDSASDDSKTSGGMTSEIPNVWDDMDSPEVARTGNHKSSAQYGPLEIPGEPTRQPGLLAEDDDPEAIKNMMLADNPVSPVLDDIVRSDTETTKRVAAIANRESLPNGEWKITDRNDLLNALRRFLKPPVGDSLSNTYGPDDIQRHIVDRARKLRLVSLLPKDWGINQELTQDEQSLSDRFQQRVDGMPSFMNPDLTNSLTQDEPTEWGLPEPPAWGVG